MIKLILLGGLGNQMFQYAAARALSFRLGCSIGANLYMFRKKSKATARDYELDVFDINLSFIDSLKYKLYIKSFKHLTSNKIGRKILEQINIFNESDIQAYDSKFESLNSFTTLLGYFQNENYFVNYSDQIRKEFSFVKELDHKNSVIKNQIMNSNSVSLHIRRGDYLNANSSLLVLNINYYQRAIEFVKSKIENPEFFIFSDDIDWVKKNLDIKDLEHTYIDWNTGKSSYIDMQLISCCKHNVIANSSFSWWGAWLNSNTDKIVICPDRWYKTDNKKDFPDGFIPKEWTILE